MSTSLQLFSKMPRRTLAYVRGISIFSILLFVALAITVTSGSTLRLDTSILTAINSASSGPLNAFFVLFTELGGVVVLSVFTIFFVIYLVIKRHVAMALFVGLSIGGVALINIVLKSLFERPRPDLWQWLVTESNFSFPSGHATASMALALCIIALVWQTKWRTFALITGAMYVLLIGFSRLCLGVHFPTDIIGGWLLAAAWIATLVLVLHTYTLRATAKGGSS